MFKFRGKDNKKLEEFLIKDNHPPAGEHEHWIIKALIKKM